MKAWPGCHGSCLGSEETADSCSGVCSPRVGIAQVLAVRHLRSPSGVPMDAEAITHVALQDLVLVENARTVRPGQDRIEAYARSIAHCGILVPLIAVRVDGHCHLLAGHTRVAALRYLATDAGLRKLASKNHVDIHHVPVRFFTGDEQRRLLLPIVENNFHDLMNEVDVANRVKLLLEIGTDRAVLDHVFGHARFIRFPQLLALDPRIQQWIKDGRLSPSTAIKFAKLITKPGALVRKLQSRLNKADELLAPGRRKLPRVTEGLLTGKQTTMRVVNTVATRLHADQWDSPGAQAVFTLLHGLQLGLKDEELVDALVQGRMIPEPPKKKRGRKPKPKG